MVSSVSTPSDQVSRRRVVVLVLLLLLLHVCCTLLLLLFPLLLLLLCCIFVALFCCSALLYPAAAAAQLRSIQPTPLTPAIELLLELDISLTTPHRLKLTTATLPESPQHPSHVP